MAREHPPQDHPLLKLHGRRVEGYTLDVEAWGGRFVAQVEFLLYLTEAGGIRSGHPVVEGLYGRTPIPGSGEALERGILDIVLAPGTTFASMRATPRGGELERGVLAALAETVADAWSAIMYLAYGWKTLKQIHELGHPLQVTDEGYLLFTLGFRGGWKDYYYCEGWLEGPIKLKAERPPTREYREAWDAENARTLMDFLKQPPAEGEFRLHEDGSDDVLALPVLALERTARARALHVLRDLELADASLREARERIVALYPFPEAVGDLSLAALKAVAQAATVAG